MPGAFSMAAEAMGVTTQKLNDMLENGEVLATDLLPKLAKVLEGRFANAAVESAQSAQAQFNRLTNTITELQRAVGESGLLDDLTDLAKETKNLIDANKDLIAGGLSSFFKIATETADGFLKTLSAISSVLDRIDKYRDKSLFGSDNEVTKEQKKLLEEIDNTFSALAILKEKKVFGDPSEVESLNKEIEKLETKSWELNEAYSATVKQQKLLKEAEGQTVDSITRGADWIMAKYQSRYKLQEELRKADLDDLGQKEQKEIAAETSKYNSLIAEAKKYYNTDFETSLIKKKEESIQKIRDEYAKKRSDLANKEANAAQRLIDKDKRERLKQLKLIQDFEREKVKLYGTTLEYNILLAQQEVEMWTEKGLDRVKAESLVNDKIKKLREDFLDDYERDYKELYLNTYEYQLFLLNKEKKDLEKAGYDEYQVKAMLIEKEKKILLEWQQAKNDIIVGFYDNIYDKDDAYYNAVKDNINAQINEWKKLGLSVEQITIGVNKLWQEFNDERAKSESNFVGSFIAGLHEYEKEYKTFGEHIAGITTDTVNNIKNEFSDNLFDYLKNDVEDFSDLWDGLMDSMLKSFTDTISDMIVQWGTQQLTSNSASLFSAQSGISSLWNKFFGENKDVTDNTDAIESLTSGTYQLDDSLGQLTGAMTMFDSDFKDYASELNNSIGDLSGSLAKTATGSTSSLFSGSSGGIWGLLGAIITLNESYQTSKGNRSDDQTQYLLDVLTTRVFAQDMTGYFSEIYSWLGQDDTVISKFLTMSAMAGTNPENALETFSILGGFDGIFNSSADPWIKYKSGTTKDLDYKSNDFGIQVQDIDNKDGVAKAMGWYFENLFKSIDKQVSFSLSDVISSISTNVEITPGEDAKFKDIAYELTKSVFKKYSSSLVEAAVGSDISGYFDFGFFKSIKTDDQETYFDTYLAFYDTVQDTADFVGDFERRIYELGETSVVAYQSIAAVNEILSAMSDLADETEKSDLSGTLDDIATTFETLTESMQDYHANLTQLAEAETNYNKALGATLTTLSASSIQSALVGNDSITDVVTEGITAFVASVYAESIMSEFLTSVNEDIGAIYRESGGDIASILDYISNIDLSGVNASVAEYNALIGSLNGSFDDATDAMKSLIDATGSLTSSIDMSDESIAEAKETFIEEGMAYIETLNDSVEANQDAIDELQDVIDSWTEFAESIRDTQVEIVNSSSVNSEYDTYKRSKSELISAYDALKSGDASGLDGIEDLLNAFSSASEQYQYTIGGLNSDLSLAMAVANLAADMAGQQGTDEEQQIAELEQQNEYLYSIMYDVSQVLDYVKNSSGVSVYLKTRDYDYDSEGFSNAMSNVLAGDSNMYRTLFPDEYTAYRSSQAAYISSYEAMEESGTLPEFASGATVTGPTLALLGEAGTEYVTPDTQMAGVKEQLRELNIIMDSILTNIGNQNQVSTMLYRKFDDIERGRTSLLTRTT